VNLDGGYGSFAMTDVNNSVNGSGMSKINGGTDLSLSAEWRPMPALEVAVDIETLLAYTSGNNYGADVDLSLPALWVGPSAYYVLPLNDQWDLRAGGGIGYVGLVSAQETIKGGGQYTAVDFSGSGFGARALVAADYYFTRHISLGLELGYRYAVINSFTKDGGAAVQKNDGGGDMSLDYSGLHSKLALGYWF